MNRKLRLLMIDDDVNLVNAVKIACEAMGYEFWGAHSATEGLEEILAVNPDLIILDVIMEDFVAGFRVVSELRTAEPGSRFAPFSTTPILMLTSVTTKTDLDFSKRVGTPLLPVDAFIEKPVKPTVLLERIKDLIGHKSSSS